jgi:hypothetical protein
LRFIKAPHPEFQAEQGTDTIQFTVFIGLCPQQCRQLANHTPCARGIIRLFASRPVEGRIEASWRSGYAEDCKSLHPGSIPGEASKFFHNDFRRLKTAAT